MPLVQLPNDQHAVIVSRDELSQRQAKMIDRAYVSAAAAASALIDNGYDENDASTWGVALSRMSDEQMDALDGYQAVLIASMVKSWSLGDLPTADSALDLPRSIFEALAKECSDAYTTTTDFSPDGVIDPKAVIAD